MCSVGRICAMQTNELGQGVEKEPGCYFIQGGEKLESEDSSAETTGSVEASHVGGGQGSAVTLGRANRKGKGPEKASVAGAE